MSESKNEDGSRGLFGAKLSLGIRTSKSAAEISKRAPPVLQEVSKLAAGVAGVASGSATGNPRNKCALKPGHSLMDWIRLGSSGTDLTGVGDRSGALRVTRDELAKHNSPEDAWIAIRGCVYNVTRYLPFHPGGEAELMRGVGQDATNLFNKVHAWVNYSQILNKCLIGRLVSKESPSGEDLRVFQTPQIDDVNITDNDSLNEQSSRVIEKLELTVKNIREAPEPTNHVPVRRSTITQQSSLKFDWIQTSTVITLIFYTKYYANCPISVTKVCVDRSSNAEQFRLDSIMPTRFSLSSGSSQGDGDCLGIKIVMDYQCIYVVELRLQRNTRWPPISMNQNYETGKCEIVLEKATAPLMWTSFGQISQSNMDMSDDWQQLLHSYELVEKYEVTHNTHLYLFKRSQEAATFIPIGYHVKMFLDIEGTLKSRPYTPILPALYTSAVPVLYSSDCLCFLIKNYPQGEVTKAIHKLHIGDNVKISRPLFSGFTLNSVEDKTRYLMIAAGTGIAPFIGLIKFVLERRHRKCKQVKLLFFNRSEEDIIWKDQFDKLETLDERFTVDYVLSAPSEDCDWKGKVGHIDGAILKNTIEDLLLVENISDTEGALNTSFIIVCGPNEFTIKANSLLTSVKLTSVCYKLRPDQIYCFMG